ncbi:MAG TPA: hypothetical protein VIY09_05940, partial [Rhizomicrobium sp.]
ELPDMDPDVIVPIQDAIGIEDEISPQPATFNIVDRALPLLTIDLGKRSRAVTTTGNLSWSDSGESGVSISGSGGIELPETAAAPASLVLSGEGAHDPFAFCGMMAALDGYPLSGRIDVFDDGKWAFMGTTNCAGIGESPTRGLSIEFLPGAEPPPTPLKLGRIAVFGHGRAPRRVESGPPTASVVYLGAEGPGMGWHAVEASGHGGICWMGPRSETSFRLRPSRTYRFVIPELRPLSVDIMPEMKISVGGASADFQIVPLRDDPSVFSVSGFFRAPAATDEDLIFRIAFPDELAKSPMELGLNDDRRSLTITVRAIALSAADTRPT